METGFRVGTLYIHYYGILVTIGVLAGIWLSNRIAKKQGKDSKFLWDAYPWLISGGVIGARVWYIVMPPELMVDRGITTKYYLTHFFEAIAIWQGGLRFLGALVGGGLTLFFFARFRGEIFWGWADTIAPGLALGQIIGSWGHFINQEFYGSPTDLPWGVFIDESNRLIGFKELSHYHPLFFYNILWNFVVMAVLLWVHKKHPKWIQTKSLFLVYLLLFAGGYFVLELLRLDVSLVAGININQLFALLIGVFSGAKLLWQQRLRNRI